MARFYKGISFNVCFKFVGILAIPTLLMYPMPIIIYSLYTEKRLPHL
jgi:hypothetical protein